MNRTPLIFLIAFAAGATAALLLRTALHRPYEAEPAPGPAHDAPHEAVTKETVEEPPVNTICAICGMDVDPEVPTARYQGKTIGFGCGACPPKFAAHPEKYGPYALKNEEAP